MMRTICTICPACGRMTPIAPFMCQLCGEGLIRTTAAPTSLEITSLEVFEPTPDVYNGLEEWFRTEFDANTPADWESELPITALAA